MPKPTVVTSQIYIQINGEDLPDKMLKNLAGVIVDQHAHLPGMFAIRFYDPTLEFLDGGVFDLTSKVKIEAETAGGKKVFLIDGEVTALEPDFGEGMVSELVVRGYDASHRLYRETKSAAYLGTRDSEIAEKFAGRANLAKEVESTPVPHDHIFQANQADLGFLRQRAWRIGYECFVSNGRFFFRKPPSGEVEVVLTWGDDLLSFHPRMTLAEQVDEVVVRGWDVETQEPIVGRAAKGGLYPQVGESKDGAAWAKAFGPGRMVIVDQPVASQKEADLLAAARLDEISGAFIEAEGAAFRRPDICAGKPVRIEGLGKRFSGQYLVTSARHEYGPDGLKTRFTVRGTRSGLLSDEMVGRHNGERWPGVVTAKVTNAEDPKGWGRVKLTFPWLADGVESDWARVMGAGAGPQAGLFAIPEVGDEVLVVFGHGDFSQPFVLGGLWNGRQPIPPEGEKAGENEKPLVRTWRSRSGHRITMFDDAGKQIEIRSAAGRRVALDDKKKQVVIQTDGVTITLKDRQLSIESDSDISVKAGGNLKLEAQRDIDIQASGQVKVKGQTILLN